jgi:hypothetical protein
MNLAEIGVGVVIGILTWPIASLGPQTGIDPSWKIGLHVAARQGLDFGHDIVFTYGPLGFLDSAQPYLGWTSAAALAFVGAVHVAACASLFHLARQRLGPIIAAVLVLGAAFTFPWLVGWRLYGLLIVVAAIAAVLRRGERPTSLLFAVGLGVAVGLAGLGKFNVAVVSVLVAAIATAVTARDPGRSMAAFAASAVLAFLTAWLVAGQRLVDIAPYVKGGIDLSAGHNESMGAVDSRIDYLSGAALLITAQMAGLVWRRSVELPRSERLALGAIFAIWLLAEYKADFIRAGVGVVIYLAALLAIWPVVAPRTRSWVVAGAPVAAILAVFVTVAMMPIASLINPFQRVDEFGRQASVALFRRTDAAVATATSLRGQYGLPPEALTLLEGRAVHVEPWEAGMAYAYPEILWRPLPVFQAYDAYTPYLDRLNAAALASDAGPERILWLTPNGAALSIDWRGFWYDSPSAKIEMVCRYAPIASTPAWQVLGRVADRCGSPVAIATIPATAGTSVAVPQPVRPGIVTMRVEGLAGDLASRLMILAYRGPSWTVSTGTQTERIPIGTARVPNILGANVDVGYRDALTLRPPPRSLVIAPEAGAPGTGSALTVVFEVIPMTATARQ